MFYWIMYILTWLPIRILLPVKIVGKKNLPKDNFVMVCNHYSNYDAVMLDSYVKKFYFLTKKEMFKTKLSAWFFKAVGCFPVDRENTDVKSIKFALQTLKKGKRLGIFPEGTRNKNADKEHMQNVKQGAVLIASKAGKQIVPILFNRPPKLFRKTTVIIGEPITLVGENVTKLSKEELERNTELMQQKMEELRMEVEKK